MREGKEPENKPQKTFLKSSAGFQKKNFGASKGYRKGKTEKENFEEKTKQR
jgi:hypothetical protein